MSPIEGVGGSDVSTRELLSLSLAVFWELFFELNFSMLKAGGEVVDAVKSLLEVATLHVQDTCRY